MSAGGCVVVVPTLNEAAHIDGLIEGLLADAALKKGAKVWIVDGGSTDGTREIVNRWSARDSRVELVDNPARTQANACNLAARRATSMRKACRASWSPCARSEAMRCGTRPRISITPGSATAGRPIAAARSGAWSTMATTPCSTWRPS